MKARIHSVLDFTEANGPGLRSAVWFQGCSIRCHGCWNPETHDEGLLEPLEVSDLFSQLASLETDGVTFTGGEPFDQSEVALELGRLLKESGKSVVVFSGFNWKEIIDRVDISQLAASFDSLVLGPYERGTHQIGSPAGFLHKEMVHLSGLYTYEDFYAVPSCEVLITGDSVVLTGLDVPLRRFRSRGQI